MVLEECAVELCCRLYESDILGVVQEILVVIYKMNILDILPEEERSRRLCCICTGQL